MESKGIGQNEKASNVNGAGRRGETIVSRHLDDLDLLSIASGTRLIPADMARHLKRCQDCRERQSALVGLMGEPTLPESIPAWNSINPLPHGVTAERSRRSPFRWAIRALVAAILGVGFLTWPRVLWPRAPWGPGVLVVMATGHAASLRPVGTRSGQVTVQWSPSAGWALLSAQNLPPLPQGQVYECWWIKGGRHIAAAVFRPGSGGSASVWMQSKADFAGVTAVGITREPEPGTTHPTGARQFFGLLVGRS